MNGSRENPFSRDSRIRLRSSQRELTGTNGTSVVPRNNCSPATRYTLVSWFVLETTTVSRQSMLPPPADVPACFCEQHYAANGEPAFLQPFDHKIALTSPKLEVKLQQRQLDGILLHIL